MIWSPLSAIASVFPSSSRREAGLLAKRWRAAASRDPHLSADLIRLGGVLLAQPVRIVEGFPEPEALDPYRLAYEAGRRDLAMQLLALMNLSIEELNILMESNDA